MTTEYTQHCDKKDRNSLAENMKLIFMKMNVLIVLITQNWYFTREEYTVKST